MTLLRMSPIGRLARTVRWSCVGTPRGEELKGRLSIRSSPPLMEVGVGADWVVRVENHSRRLWHRTGKTAVGLQCRWVARSGKGHGDLQYFPLPRTFLPGDWSDLTLKVNGPKSIGDFMLHWEVTVGMVPTATVSNESIPVSATFPRATDIDYHHVYRSADLATNSWWVVGAYHTAEQYAQSAAARRQMLIENGLTPDSRVLDIGCGTGQMAMALEGYLSDRGKFYGTDIGQEGIDFCRRTYRRSNFKFATGDMTRVPFADGEGPFDMAIFFSVFTHTFVDESVLLLAEARRLLAPSGVIIADVITSDLVARGAGHRGEMWVNREHFLRLVESLGLRSEVIGTVPWAPDAERLMLRLTRT